MVCSASYDASLVPFFSIFSFFLFSLSFFTIHALQLLLSYQFLPVHWFVIIIHLQMPSNLSTAQRLQICLSRCQRGWMNALVDGQKIGWPASRRVASHRVSRQSTRIASRLLCLGISGVLNNLFNHPHCCPIPLCLLEHSYLLPLKKAFSFLSFCLFQGFCLFVCLFLWLVGWFEASKSIKAESKPERTIAGNSTPRHGLERFSQA